MNKKSGKSTAAVGENIVLLRRQNVLLEVIAAATARLMQLAEQENKLNQPPRRVADPHGLCAYVDRQLTEDTFARILASSTEGPIRDTNSGTKKAADTGGDN
jgi:hypothetical protein